MPEKLSNPDETPEKKSFWELLSLLKTEGLQTTDARYIMVAWPQKDKYSEDSYKYIGSQLSTGRVDWRSYIEMHATWLMAQKPWETERKLDTTITVVFAGKDGTLSAFSQRGVRFPSAYPIQSEVASVMKNGEKITPENMDKVLAAMKNTAHESITAWKKSSAEKERKEAAETAVRDTARRELERTQREEREKRERAQQAKILKTL